MSSNSLSEARKYLQGALTQGLPKDWVITDIEKAGDTFRKLTVTYEQGDIVANISGGELPPGVIGLEFTLNLITPEKDGDKAMTRLGEAAVELAFLLDSLPQLVWDNGSRFRLESGESGYRFPITVLVTYSPAPEEE